MNQSEVETIAKRIASRELGKTSVDRVIVRKDQDADGDAIWRIVVVVKGSVEIAAKRFSPFLRYLIKELGDSQPFPVVSFRSVHDDRGLTSEAA